MAKKTKKFNTGGFTITPTETNQSSAYPFTNQSVGTGMSSSEGSGMNQTFNIQPSATAGQPQQPFKKGGVIKDLKKAGFYDAKKDKAKRLNIINKVTTKPERIEMVDKMFSAKKMAKGGTASSRADGCAVRGKTRA